MDVAHWLRTLNLGQYEAAFREHSVGMDVLPSLTAADLQDLGVIAVGDRRRLLNAIAALRSFVHGVDEQNAEEPPAERRQLTVMFCDIAGSTALSTRLDPEDLSAVVLAYQSAVRSTISRFGGFIARYVGDGVLIYFGWPEAHETDAESAVRAALAVIAAVSESPMHGEHLSIRVGIATGLVVIGSPIGEGDARQQTAIGETPNLAARLQSLAAPNSVVIAASTRRLLGDLFHYRDLGTSTIKGIAAPVPAWQVLHPSNIESRFEALHGSALSPLVGRDEEIDLLLRRWTRAKASDGQVVLISGEPGIGKSRITAALQQCLSKESHLRLRYVCSPYHRDSALFPFIEQLERAAGFARDDQPAAKVRKLADLLASAAPPDEDVALLVDLLSLPPGEHYVPTELSSQRKKERTMAALVRQLRSLAGRQPIVVVFEDAHWSDPTSLELLDLTIEQIRSLAVLLLVTFRTEFHPPWTGQSHVTTLTLPRLDRRNTAAMVASVAGTAALSPEIAAEIAERTDGVPLFVEELTQTVLELGMQAPEALSSTPHSGLPVPATLYASLMARLDRLGPAAKAVAQTGAVIGREFGYQLLVGTADLPETELRGALDKLINAGLLFIRGAPPQSNYIFKHALVQDAAYGTLLRSRRQQLHGRIAGILEQQFPEFALAQPARLALHFAAAGQAEQAVAFWLKAGQQALARSAMTEAVSQLRKALDLLAALPDGPWRRQQELDLQTSLASALMATKGYAAAGVNETLARARALAEQLDRTDYLIPLIAGQWSVHLVRAEHRAALPLAERLEQIGEVRADVLAQLLGRLLHGCSHELLGEFATAHTLLEQCFGLADPAHRAIGGLAFAPYATLLANLARTLAYLGYVDKARSRMEEALDEVRRLHRVNALVHILNFATWLDWLTYSPLVHLDELLALANEYGFPFFSGWVKAYRGQSLVGLGQAQEGLSLLTQGLAELRECGVVCGTPMVLTWLAEAHVLLGQPAQGHDYLAEAARIVEATDERLNEADLLYRVRGDLLNAAGQYDGAEHDYHQAIAIAKRQGAKLFQLRASTSLARLWRDQGKPEAARNLLGPIYQWFTEGFDARDLIDAKKLLIELGCGPDQAA
jgi:class 3 adenylate cyclase/tetratricopeptide (TPR) repeat protein